MNQNIPSHSDNSSYSTVDDLVGRHSVVSDDTFLVRDSNSCCSYSIYLDSANLILLEIDNDPSFVSELESYSFRNGTLLIKRIYLRVMRETMIVT